VTLTLNRAEKKNALSIALRDELSDALEDLGGDEAVKAVVITGAGDIFSAGFDLAVMSDVRVAADTARFSHPEIEFGDVVYGPLHDIVGGGLARELCFTGRVVEAPEAKALGLVSSVVPVAELAGEVKRFTDLIGRAPRDVLLRTKAKAIRRAAVVRDKTLDL